MPYYIGYKGKKLGSALSKSDAEEKLANLSRLFNQLEIIKEQSAAVSPERKLEVQIGMAGTFIHPTSESTLYSERR